MPLKYVLITPARNEEAFIKKTIQSVVSQTLLPLKWVIVSDGSTDDTDKIVKEFAVNNPWMELVHTNAAEGRNFARKVHCFNLGRQKMEGLEYDIIGNLDADVSFDANYFEYLLSKFETKPNLGVAGTPYLEGGYHSFKDSQVNIHHVHGQVQLFRRKCYEDIGGYTPVPQGGIDWIAVTTARKMGWQTYSFQDMAFQHHRPMGTGACAGLMARYRHGVKDYFLGGDPVWQLCRCAFQALKKPYLIGGALLLFGYYWSWVIGAPRAVDRNLIIFHRKEQKARLRKVIRNMLKPHLHKTITML